VSFAPFANGYAVPAQTVLGNASESAGPQQAMTLAQFRTFIAQIGVGGVLSGSLTDPGFSVDMATQAELQAWADSLAAVALSGAYADLTGKPTLGTAAAQNTSAFEASGAITTHAAVTSGVHGISAFGATLVDDADAAAARTTLGLGSIATQAANAAAITGGAISGITDLAIADGGTGASTAALARANLGCEAMSGGYVDGIMYTSYNAISTTTLALTANRQYMVPFRVTEAWSPNRIGISVTIGSTGNARLGIYNGNATHPTGTPIYDSGLVDVGSAAPALEAVISGLTLQPGVYWLALNCNSTPTVVAELSSSAGGMTRWFNFGRDAITSPATVLYFATVTFAALTTFTSSPSRGTTPPSIYLVRR
jgi:hypothetical protein